MMDSTSTYNTLPLGESNRKYGTWLAYAYLFFLYVRPQEYIPGMTAIPTSGVIALLFAIWGFFHFRVFLIKSPLFLILLLGLAYGLSSIDAVNVSSHRFTLATFIEAFPQCLALYILFDSKERVINLLKCWCVIYFFVALITIKNGGRGPGDFTGDENDVALVLSMGLPISLYGFWCPGFGKKFKYFSLISALIIVIAIVVTSSRGGFLGLIAVLLMLWWLSKNRFKIAIISIFSSLLLSGILFSVLPEGYLNEMQSINNTEDDTRVQRLQLWETAWVMYKDNPWVGVGVSNQRFNMSKYARDTSWYTYDGDGPNYQGKLVHSVYLQVLSETGTFGGLISFYIMFALPFVLFLKRKGFNDTTSEDTRLIGLLVKILIITMGAYVVSGAFISVAYYPHIAIWIAMYAITKRLMQMQESESENLATLNENEFQQKEQKAAFKWENGRL